MVNQPLIQPAFGPIVPIPVAFLHHTTSTMTSGGYLTLSSVPSLLRAHTQSTTAQANGQAVFDRNSNGKPRDGIDN